MCNMEGGLRKSSFLLRVGDESQGIPHIIYLNLSLQNRRAKLRLLAAKKGFPVVLGFLVLNLQLEGMAGAATEDRLGVQLSRAAIPERSLGTGLGSPKRLLVETTWGPQSA